MVNSINFHGSDFLICQRNGSAYPTSLILSNSLPLANSQCIENPDLPPLTFQYELDAKQKEQGSSGRQPTALWVNLASIFECPDAIAVSKSAYVTCMSQTHSRLQLETHITFWRISSQSLVLHQFPRYSWEVAQAFSKSQVGFNVCNGFGFCI